MVKRKSVQFQLRLKNICCKRGGNIWSRIAIWGTFVKDISCLNPHCLEKLGVTIVVKRFANIVHS